MTEITREDEVRYEAHLRGGQVVKYDSVSGGYFRISLGHNNEIVPSDISTADGREAILELCGFALVTRWRRRAVLEEGARQEWAAAYPIEASLTEWLDSPAEAITAAWRAAVARWKEDRDE